VLCLTVASGISSMFQSATLAAEMATEHRVRVFDSGTAAGGLRLLALEAARLAGAGHDLDALQAELQALSGRIRMFGALETIEYLARSGRVPQVASWGAEKLGVKPVVEFAGGRGSLVTLARGREAARHSLADVLVKRVKKDGAAEDGSDVHATVFHADAAEDAELLRAEIGERLPAAELTVSLFTPAMGVHTGPGVLGHAFYVDGRE
jgi:DegV family protein with EDD domain